MKLSMKSCITFLTLHQCMSWTGYQPSPMFCLLNGAIVRFNFSDCSPKAPGARTLVTGHSQAWSIMCSIFDSSCTLFDVVSLSLLVHLQAGKERILPHILLQVKSKAYDPKRDYIPQAALLPYVHREFFQVINLLIKSICDESFCFALILFMFCAFSLCSCL